MNISLDYCAGSTAKSPDDLLAIWKNNQDCQNLIIQSLYGSVQTFIPCSSVNDQDNNPVPYLAQGITSTQDAIQKLFEKYSELGYSLGARKSDANYHPFQDYITENICKNFPIVCESALENFCSNFAIKQLSINSDLNKLCGCYLPQKEISHYLNDLQITNECTPLCNRDDTIKRVDSYGNCKTCQQSICLIDNVTISLINSHVGGSINVENFCGSCGSNSECICMITDSTIEILNSKVNKNIDVTANCKSNICYVENKSGVGPGKYPVSCEQSSVEYSPYSELVSKTQQVQRRSMIISWVITGSIVIGIILVTLIILFLISKLWKKKQ